MPSLLPCAVNPQRSFINTEMIDNITAPPSKVSSRLGFQIQQKIYYPTIPGLPDDVAKLCLAFVPRTDFPVMAAVSNNWRSLILSKEFLEIRKEAQKLEELLYMLVGDPDGNNNHWEVLTRLQKEPKVLPPMPGPAKAGFGVVTLEGKLFVIGGYTVGVEKRVSDDVYQYDSRLNRWTLLAKMNVARHNFACAQIDNVIYAVGGFGSGGDCLSSVETYDPNVNKWTFIDSLRRPRWGSFACNLEGKLYVMGGRSTFTIGNFKSVDVYSPEDQSWSEMKNGCVMVTSHAVLNKKLFCIEWKNERNLAIYTPANDTWVKVPMPITGSSTVGYRLGIFDGKLLLFPIQKVPGYNTLLYDPDAAAGSQWKTSSIKPSRMCLCSVTMRA